MNAIDAHEAGVQINVCEHELEYVEDMPRERRDKYKDAKENVQITEETVARLKAEIEAQNQNIDQIRLRWLNKLESLVEDISERFSAFFEHMGYAGEIRLNKGAGNENDFANYGNFSHHSHTS